MRFVSYTRFHENYKACLKELSYDEKLYRLHSFRAGGAITIAKSLTAPNKERYNYMDGRKQTLVKTCILKKIK
jgi:hypothetical protein